MYYHWLMCLSIKFLLHNKLKFNIAHDNQKDYNFIWIIIKVLLSKKFASITRHLQIPKLANSFFHIVGHMPQNTDLVKWQQLS